MSHRLASAGANKLAAGYDAPIMYRVLLTDYAWPDLEIERAILKKADAELIVAEKPTPPRWPAWPPIAMRS